MAKTDPQAPTYAQLGDAAEPSNHTANRAPDTDYPDTFPQAEAEGAPPVGDYAPTMHGGFRAPSNVAPATGHAGISTTGVHESAGEPDRRRQWGSDTGYPESDPAESAYVDRVTIQDHGAVSIPGVAPLTVNRAGSTSADPAHAVGVPRALFDRPFDQDIAHHPYGEGKIPTASPLASLPMSQSIATGGALPTPGGVSGVTKMSADPLHRNTVRMVPTPWDTDAVVGTTVTPVTGGGWKLS